MTDIGFQLLLGSLGISNKCEIKEKPISYKGSNSGIKNVNITPAMMISVKTNARKQLTQCLDDCGRH